jgi:hypothetical protein
VLQKAAELVPGFVSGSADLDPSTKTRIKKGGSFTAKDRTGRTLHYGIREHAMGAILNGITLHSGFLPAGSTFLVFADYMRTPIRLASLMKIPTTFVFTHDSLMVGEDGPTHQPVEHLATLRVIPNVHVFRPADGAETGGGLDARAVAPRRPGGAGADAPEPDKLPHAAGWSAREALRGGYVLVDTPGAKATIVATGAEVSLAVDAATLLGPRRVCRRAWCRCRASNCSCSRTPATAHGARQGRGVRVEMGRPELVVPVHRPPRPLHRPEHVRRQRAGEARRRALRLQRGEGRGARQVLVDVHARPHLAPCQARASS